LDGAAQGELNPVPEGGGANNIVVSRLRKF
jgi:hypothetical protein